MTNLTGIFGGTFDPPHLGHLILASESLSQLGLDRLLWVLTPSPPHKPGDPISPLPQRIDMLRRATADESRFEICNVEMERPGPHYTVDTLRLLKKQDASRDLVFLMGGDSLRDLPTWREPQQLLALCAAIGVMRRPGDAVNLDILERQIPGISAKVRFVDVPLLEISSSQVRERVARKAMFRYYLHPDVYAYILQNKLYQKP